MLDLENPRIMWKVRLQGYMKNISSEQRVYFLHKSHHPLKGGWHVEGETISLKDQGTVDNFGFPHLFKNRAT